MKNYTDEGIHYSDLGDPQRLPIILIHGMTFESNHVESSNSYS